MKNKITDKNIEAFKAYVPGHNLDEISSRFGVCKSYVTSVLKILALRGVDLDYVRRPCGAKPGSKHKRSGESKSSAPQKKEISFMKKARNMVMSVCSMLKGCGR